ncbi:protein CANDIDATE G-PROTEIN COUPLED RECEPTOR 7-like [Andrographis paniculata]|uniref:protein CANDIDATE G-PROTEIN COUPLED RECEPTOR 7-like n=1 Tax=Andrographis paniculata TaxID=175694 RepID=UPI0021E8BDBB|nr:protein CANDIDATE G-PROTEIN COUPLED RECEPTOR 7-like [Andrographis paniculata]
MAKLQFLFLLHAVLLLLLRPTSAEIKNLKISSDSRPMILFERFGFTHTGQVNISVSSVSAISLIGSIDPSRLGFFLLSEESLIQVLTELQANPTICVLDSKYITLLFNFKDLSPPPHSSFSRSYPIAAPNEYSLFFANCAPESKVSMDVRTELYNLDGRGRVKDYLSAGLTQLPSLYFFFSVLYFAFFGYWIYSCLQNKKSVHRIHLLMGLLVIMKALNLLCAAEDKHYVKVTGTPHGWDVLFYIFQFIRVVLLFTVIVLIGTGWSFLKPFLQEREKKVLMIVIPLQVLANVASIVIGETGPFIKDWVTWNQVFLLVDIICCCAIIFPIVWSIRSLRETSKTDGKAARNLAKLTLFRQFYIVVIGYLYFTRIVVFALRTIAAYKYQWVANAAEEIASLAFYTIIFYMFRPVEKNEYFALDDEEEEAAEMALRDEEFEL